MNPLLLALTIAACFVLWPIIGQYSKVNGGWMATIILAGTATTAAVWAKFRGELTDVPDLRAILILLGAGVVNGIGGYLYARSAADPNIPTGILVISVNVLVALLAPIASMMILKVAPTPRELVGLAFGVVAMWLLKK